MASGSPGTVAGFVRKLASCQSGDEAQDAELLRRFAACGDASAFELLFWRHERMVTGVCRRVLRDAHDAEDVAQATFLTLALKARSISSRGALATWLYTVAYRLALNALRERKRRRARAGPLRAGTEVVAPEIALQPDFALLLDGALARLPEIYRTPIVLCHLEGLSHAEAAAVLGCPEGTLASRLARGKERLRRSLGSRGVSVSAGALAASLAAAGSRAASARAAAAAAVRAARAVYEGGGWPSTLPPRVVALARGLEVATLRARCLQWAAAIVVALVCGAGWSVSGSPPPDAATGTAEPPGEAAGPAAPGDQPARVDALGDPLPAGAIARLGSLRFFFSENRAHRVALSGDGRLVVSSGENNRLWDAQTGKELPLDETLRQGRLFATDGGLLRQVRFSATKGGLVALKSEKAGVTLWDAVGRKEIARLPSGIEFGPASALSPDGRTLTSFPCTSDNAGKATCRLALVDASTGAARDGGRIPGDGPRASEFSADSNTLATCFADNSIEVWDLRTRSIILSVPPTNISRYQVALSPDGGTLAAAEYGEKRVQLWDVRGKKELKSLPTGVSSTRGVVAYSPDGKFLAVGYEADVGLWDVAARKQVRRLTGFAGGLSSLSFSADGKRLAAGTNQGVAIWDTESGLPRPDLGHGYSVDALEFTPDGRTVATGAGYTDATVRMWDAFTGQAKGCWRGHREGVEALAYSPDGTLLASGSQDTTVRLWDTATGKQVGSLKAFDGMIYTLAFSPDGKTLAAGGKRKVVHFWDVATRQQVRAIDNPGGLTLKLAFSRDGKLLATRGFDEDSVRVWDVATGTELRQIRGVKGGCPKVCFAPDNRTLAVNCDDGSVRLLDASTGRQIRPMGEPPAPGKENRCLAVALSPDGRSVAAGYDDLSVRLWEAASGRERARFTGHRAAPWTLAFSPDGSVLASGAWDRTALVWDVVGTLTSNRRRVLAPEDRDRLWSGLADPDAARAFEAIRTLRANALEAVSLLRERLRPATGVDAKEIARLVTALDAEEFAEREKASTRLAVIGDSAEPALRAALDGKPSPEKLRRIERLLDGIDGGGSPEAMRALRAVEVLEGVGTPEARRVLESVASGAAEARITREAKAALARVPN